MKKMCLAIFVALTLTGCATTDMPRSCEISIDSINNSEILSQKSCAVVSGLKDVSTGDLQFQEYASYVKRALTLKGYSLLEDMEKADVVVFLGYGISEPQEHVYSYAVPIFGQTGVSSAHTTGSAFVSGNQVFGSSTTTYSPSFGVVGAATRTKTVVTFKRQISLMAYDMKHYRETKKEKQLWKTEIISIGPSGDFRFLFPLLVGGASRYIGENTKNIINIEMSEDHDDVLDVKGISTMNEKQKECVDSGMKNYLNMNPNAASLDRDIQRRILRRDCKKRIK